MAFKYPIDVCTSQNKKQTYSVESHLTPARTSDNQSPLKIFNETFSLYKHAIVEKDAEHKVVSANINVKEMEDIRLRTQYAFNKSMEYETMPVTAAEGVENSPAYTVKIPTGSLKGKTPAEVLIENPGNKELLNKHYQWLKENLAKYPRNKEQMDAIADAARLQKEGKLTASETPVVKPRIRIYPATAQPTPKPLRRKVREDGKSFVYEMEIHWNVGDAYPVEITIRNYWAPVTEMEDRTIRVVQKEAADKVEKTMRLGEADWMNHLRTMLDDMKAFELLYAKQTRADAEAVLKQNREENRAQR